MGARAAPAFLRAALLRAGRRLSPASLAGLRSALSYLELGAWAKEAANGRSVIRVESVFDLFGLALARIEGERPLYLEYGVYKGRSMRWWSEHLTAPGAQFVGFDSFEGLPEDWRPGLESGHFQTGKEPDIDDPRVRFVKGWFDDTVPGFALPDHDQLVINVDCDLYSSANTVMRFLEPHIVPGTLIYFDELPDRDHEMRALFESLARSGMTVEPIGFARGGLAWLFRYV
jgi:hypothetical protein